MDCQRGLTSSFDFVDKCPYPTQRTYCLTHRAAFGTRHRHAVNGCVVLNIQRLKALSAARAAEPSLTSYHNYLNYCYFLDRPEGTD